jgi:hypothetical protein
MGQIQTHANTIVMCEAVLSLLDQGDVIGESSITIPSDVNS